MPGSVRRYVDGSYLRCQRTCEETKTCLGIEVRIRESFPKSYTCDLFYDASRYQAGQEEPVSVCTKAKPSFPYTTHHVAFWDKNSFGTNCSDAVP